MMTRLARSLAILAVMLRVLLPALHSHAHHQTAPAGCETGLATVCSCGAVHPGDDRKGEGERAESSPEGHHCLACEIEEGIPCGCPTSLDWSVIDHGYTESLAFAAQEVLVANQLALPQQRAPPSQRS